MIRLEIVKSKCFRIQTRNTFTFLCRREKIVTMCVLNLPNCYYIRGPRFSIQMRHTAVCDALANLSPPWRSRMGSKNRRRFSFFFFFFLSFRRETLCKLWVFSMRQSRFIMPFLWLAGCYLRHLNSSEILFRIMNAYFHIVHITVAHKLFFSCITRN